MIPRKNTVQRNSPCPCGSDKKMKRCCIRGIRAFQERVNNGENPMNIIVDNILTDTPSEPETQPDPSSS